MFQYMSINGLKSIIHGHFWRFFKETLETIILLAHDISHTLGRRDLSIFTFRPLASFFYFTHIFLARTRYLLVATNERKLFRLLIFLIPHPNTWSRN